MPQIKLPTLQLPTFNGNHTDWPLFLETFKFVKTAPLHNGPLCRECNCLGRRMMMAKLSVFQPHITSWCRCWRMPSCPHIGPPFCTKAQLLRCCLTVFVYHFSVLVIIMARNWTNDETFRFLEIYQNEPVIWNPKHKNYKDKTKVNDAWSRLSQIMNIPIIDLKKKKESLMTAFRTHLKKKKRSIRSGAGADDVYKPIWIFYDVMEVFMKNVYECPSVKNTEDNELELNPEQPDENPVKKRRSTNPPELQEASKQMKQAFSILNTVLANKQQKVDDDDSSLYGRLLADKLREFSKADRQEVMYEIDGFLLQRLKNTRNSPTSFDAYLSNSPSHT